MSNVQLIVWAICAMAWVNVIAFWIVGSRIRKTAQKIAALDASVTSVASATSTLHSVIMDVERRVAQKI